MRTVTFQSVLNGVAAKLGMDPLRDLNAARAASLTEYINTRLAEAWKFDFFPEWTVVESRYYRDVYSAAANVAAGDERLFVGDGNYYQALRAQTPAIQAPATRTGSVYVENSAYWALSAASYSGNDWAAGTVFALADKTRNLSDGFYYQCHTPHTAGAAFDTTKFGVLTPFNRYIAYEQTGKTPLDEVKTVSRRNPRVFPTTYGPVKFAPSDAGIQILDPNAPNVVFVQFRLRVPKFSSTPYSATGNVAVNDLRYYATTGECYLALQAQTPATQPPTTAAYWSKVNFPSILENFVKRAAYCDCLTDQKQQDRKNTELTEALNELADAADRALAAQGQYDRATVETYGS